MQEKNVDGIIFDIDGTLWDVTEIVAEAWNRVLEAEQIDLCLTADDLKREFGKPLETIGEDLLSMLSPQKRQEILNRWIDAQTRSVTYGKELLEDRMEEVLSELSERYPLFIVTNAEKGYIETLYRATGFEKYFTDQLCFGDTGRPKGENIRLLVQKNQLKDPVYVGDTLGDMDAAYMAGVRFVHAAYGYGSVTKYDYQIEKPTDLLKFF